MFEGNRTKTVGGDRFTSSKHVFCLSYDLNLTPRWPRINTPVMVVQVHAKAILYSKFEGNRTKTVGGDRSISSKHVFCLSYDLYLTPRWPPIRTPVGVDQVHAKAILYSKFEGNRTKTVGGDRFTSSNRGRTDGRIDVRRKAVSRVAFRQLKRVPKVYEIKIGLVP